MWLEEGERGREGGKGRKDRKRKPGQILSQLSLSLVALILTTAKPVTLPSVQSPHSDLAPPTWPLFLPLSSSRNWEVQIADSALQLSTLGMFAYLSSPLLILVFLSFK